MLQTTFTACEQPFDLNPDPRFLYLNSSYREAVSSLLYRIQAGSGFMAMIAQPGMGKTVLLFHLLERLRPAAKTAFIFQTQCTSSELMQHIAMELECGADITDPIRLSHGIKSFLLKEANDGRRCVLVIDEAQNLLPEALETIRLLSNFETPRRKLIQIILSGQSELDAMFARPELRQLRQRLSHIIHLERFTPEETTFYIAHRLRVAGYACSVSQLFNVSALVRISQLSAGVPRVINNICSNALSLAFALDFEQVDGDVIDEVANDLGLACAGSSISSLNSPLSSAAPAPDSNCRAYAAIEAACSLLDDEWNLASQTDTSLVPAEAALSGESVAAMTAEPLVPAHDGHTLLTSSVEHSSNAASHNREEEGFQVPRESKENPPGLSSFTTVAAPATSPWMVRSLRRLIHPFLLRLGTSMLVLCIAHASSTLTPSEHAASEGSTAPVGKSYPKSLGTVAPSAGRAKHAKGHFVSAGKSPPEGQRQGHRYR